MIDRHQIVARLDYANRAIENGQEQDIPVKMLVCDVENLLDLLQKLSAAPDIEQSELFCPHCGERTVFPTEDDGGIHAVSGGMTCYTCGMSAQGLSYL